MTTHPMWTTLPADRTTVPAGEPDGGLQDAIEKALLGAVPDDHVEFPAQAEGSRRPNRAATRVTVVRSFLAEHPDVRDAIERELYETWARVGRDRAEYLAVVAPLTGELVSRAELHQVTAASPDAVAGLLGAIARYLADV
jgi:hypothetical protein